jgi:hypothetical protein
MSKSINGEHHKPREQVKNLDLEKPAKDLRGRRGWRKKETVCKYSFFKEFSASCGGRIFDITRRTRRSNP